MTSICPCALFSLLFFVVTHAQNVSVTPVEKVITLLEDLKVQISDEAKAEGKIYDEFGCFCKDTTKTKSDSIEAAQDTIDSTSATIAQKSAEKKDAEVQLLNLKQVLEDTNKELAEKKAIFLKDTETYNAKNLDLKQALHACGKAITSLKAAETNAKAGAALLELGKSVRSSLSLQRIVNLLQPHQLQDLSALLQEGVDPLDPSYSFHSGGIIGTLTDLQTMFNGEKNELDIEWGKTQSTFSQEESALNAKITSTETEIGSTETKIETLGKEIGQNKETLVQAEGQLTDDSAYLHDLTVRCETKAREWDQRSTMRNDELAALTQALTILKDQVKDLDTKVNKRAIESLVARTAPSAIAHKSSSSKPAATITAKGKGVVPTPKTNGSHAPPVGAAKALLFFQAHASKSSSQRFLASVQTHADKNNKERVLELLQKEGSRLGSAMLSTAVGRIAQIPLVNSQMEKVKSLIMNLLDRLLKEQNSEATKKGYCDKELGEIEHDRKERFLKVTTLNADLASLEAKKDALAAQIEELKNGINSTTDALITATSLRLSEKAQNNKTVLDATEGFKAVSEALSILKEFYKKAGKATVSLLQTSASPIEENITEGGALTGAYTGSQASAINIISLLEVIRDDFDRTIRTTEASERAAAAEFVQFDRTSKMSIKSMETQEALSTQDHGATKTAIDTTFANLESTQSLLDESIKAIEGLKEMCIDTGMSYAERKQKREEEIAALKRALEILKPSD